MKDWFQWLPFSLSIITTIVTVVWSWAKLDKKIDVSDVRTAEKFKNLDDKVGVLGNQIAEIKENHLHELKDDIKAINERINRM